MPGYEGRLLRVNLSSSETSQERLDANLLPLWVGGTGFGAQVLYREVPPGVEWSDAENRLILASGPLGGTRVVGTGTFSVVTKGCLTNGATASQANGYFGAYLRFSGFEGVVIEGRAPRWLYLYVHDGQAELRDATHLRGKDTWETKAAIAEELGLKERELSVACIGPAGENLVKLAAICSDDGHVAGHNGTGAVMGSKRLKAIVAARGKSNVPVSDRSKLSSAAQALFEGAKLNDFMGQKISDWGTLFPHEDVESTGILPINNYTTNIFPDREAIKRFTGEYIRDNFEPEPHPCWACRMHHCHKLKIPYGPYKGRIVEEPEYEGLAAWGGLIGQTDVATAAMLANEVDRLGIDTNEAGWIVGLVMECFEKGILGLKDTDGLEMRWGNAAATRELLHKIAWRDGFGDVLAEGVMRASRHIGGEAPNMAIHTMKGSTPRGHDHRARWTEMMDTVMGNTGTLESVTRSGEGLGLLPPDPYSAEEVSTFNAKVNGRRQFEDSLGICNFCVGGFQALVDCANAAAGWQLDIPEAMRVGRRIVNTLRAFNLRHGITAAVEYPSPRYGSTPIDGPAAGKSIMPHWDLMRRNYYKNMGWDENTGVPLPETLRDLGLGHIAEDLWAARM